MPTNRYMITWGQDKDGEYVAFMNPPKFSQRLTIPEALEIAAFLLCTADPDSAGVLLESDIHTNFHRALVSVVAGADFDVKVKPSSVQS